MEAAALGRPFCLGMLYDCRRDLLIPGKISHVKIKSHIFCASDSCDLEQYVFLFPSISLSHSSFIVVVIPDH